MKRLIIYDLDGTLVDTGDDIVQAVNVVVASMGAPPLPPHEIRAGVGGGVANLIARSLKIDDPARIEAGVRLFRDYYGAHLTDHSRLYPGVRKLLNHFRTRIQVVLTNKPDWHARALLTALGVAQTFAKILAADARVPVKPDPAAAHALLSQYRVGAKDALMVGDSPIDIETGRRAGIPTVVVSQGFSDAATLRAAAPDFLVRDVSDVLALARRQQW